ncbi:MAG: RNA polymerase sigma factor [Candidatus Acidiferrales bacterium]
MASLDRAAVLALAKPGGMPDEEVVERVLAGEVALYEILMRRYNQRLYRVARAILGNDSEAEDVMQDAYVRAYAHLNQFAGRAKFSTWLTKIAVHEALARMRRARRFEVINPTEDSESDGMPPVVSHGRDPERQLFDQEMKALLEATINALPEEYRSVFVLREAEGMSTAETAEALEISEEAVKTRLHRARAMLQGELFERVGASTRGAFEFHLSRCDRVVAEVFKRIAPATP